METKDILKQLRKTHRYSISEICNRTGIPISVYPKYENGIRNIGVPALCKLADLYNVTTDYILGIESSPPNSITPEMQELIRKLESYPLEVQNRIVEFLKQLAE